MDINEDLKKACEVLRQGGTILYPTDTIWGICCDASNPDAVSRIYQIKQRDDSKSMLALLDSSAKLDYYVEDFPEIALDIIEMSCKPVTIIYPNARHLAHNLLASDGSIGIRITKEVFSQQLCRQFRGAIVSTSANRSEQPAPANFRQIAPEIRSAVDYIVEYRQNESTESRPSSILKLGKGGLIEIIRE